MNTLIYRPLCLLLAVFLFACKKEAALTPSTQNVGYVVPQGNHDYDTTILNFYNKYGKYLLYQFQDQDTYWTPTGWKNATPNTTFSIPGFWNNGYLVVKADTMYVKKQLSLLDSTWFSLYSDKFLTTFLPVKIMLCSQVDSVYTAVISYSPFTFGEGITHVPAYYNYDNICVNDARSYIDSMTAADKKRYMAKVNAVFAQSIIGRSLIQPTTDFTSVANYATTYTSYAAAYAQGILYAYYNTPTATLDWGLYLTAMMTTSETNLNASTPSYDATFNGILNPTKDVNGKIRSRYDMVRNYYITNYNVDLQTIGNMVN